VEKTLTNFKRDSDNINPKNQFSETQLANAQVKHTYEMKEDMKKHTLKKRRCKRALETEGVLQSPQNENSDISDAKIIRSPECSPKRFKERLVESNLQNSIKTGLEHSECNKQVGESLSTFSPVKTK